MMILGLVLLSLLTLGANAQTVPNWENPLVVGINKKPYHASLVLPSMEHKHEQIHSLNGIWRFHWSPRPEHRPADFYRMDFDVSSWDSIVVPGNWQMQGFGKPIYINISYPFQMDQPRVTSEPPSHWFSYINRNPVGSYVTTFQVARQTEDKVYFLYFEGVESAMYVWVNGQMVGYSENSYSPAGFDITNFVRVGENRLAVEVYRWSDGSYLENQDFWRLSGIFRPVELWIRPKTHIRNYAIIANPSTDFTSATVGARVWVRNQTNRSVRNLQLEVTIAGTDRAGQRVERTMVQQVPAIGANAEVEVELKDMIANPRLWSSEDPYLYDVSVSLRGRRNAIERFQNHLGVRRVEMVGEVMKINGRPVKLKGVNRHDHHPRTGRYVDPATTELDVQLIKQGNFNMVRTAHYPHSALFFELADRYGLYVMVDANQESHGYGIGNTIIGDNPDWTKAHVDRAVSMVQRDKNHPSILFWSLGNEGGRGLNKRAMREAVLAIDTTRLIHSDSDRSVSDMYDEGYLHPDTLRNLARRISNRPVFMREYAHAMGNSLGNLQEYWDVIEADKSIAGAAIWDWVDQAIAKRKDGAPLSFGSNPFSVELKPDEFWAFGGDFGDHPNDGSFCINGLVGADRVANPHFFEAQRVQEDIDFRLIPGSTNVQVISKLHFTSLHNFSYAYEFLINGKVVRSNSKPLSANYVLEIPAMAEGDGELMLNVYAKLAQPTLWADKGFVVAREQFVIRPHSFTKISPEGMPPVIRRTELSIEVTAGPSVFIFDAANGALKSWKVNNREALHGVLEPYFWKPANENQLRNDYNRRLAVWRYAAQNRELKRISSRTENGLAVVEFDMTLPVGADYRLKYTINGAGRLQVEADYKPHASYIVNMPKFGMRMRLPSEMNSVEWYGRGEFENYPDRQTAALVRHFQLPLEAFITHYVVPQDNANRGDVRWFALHGASGKRLRVTGLQPLHFRAWPYGEEDIEGNTHNHRLPRRDFVNVNIDYDIKGVGGNDSWGARTMDQFLVDANRPYSYGFILELDND